MKKDEIAVVPRPRDTARTANNNDAYRSDNLLNYHCNIMDNKCYLRGHFALKWAPTFVLVRRVT